MEYIMLGFVSFILSVILLGWVVIGASPIIAPIIGLVYLFLKSEKTVQPFTQMSETSYGVLVVDDQYTSVIPLIKMLEQASIPFKYVNDGIEAVKELSQNQFQLIFMDQYMPSLTGSETLSVADQIINPTEQVPVIFYSATDMKTKVIGHLRHLMVLDFWDKTWSRMELQEKLKKLELTPQLDYKFEKIF